MKPLVIIGDALLDVDIEGTVERLCPEAPVPVVDVVREWHRPGGAGLAALLAARSAPEVVLVSAIGTDRAGDRLSELIERHAELIPLPLTGSTVRKSRVRAADQSLLRLDSGDGRAASAQALPSPVVKAIRGAGAVLVADYGRGVAAHPGIRALLRRMAPRVPLVWDPHPKGAAPIAGARLATPNEAEARRFADEGDIRAVGASLRTAWSSDGVAVTLGSRGALLSGPDGTAPAMIPISPAARVVGATRPDTCGAGDRFASAAAAALLDGASLTEAVTTAVDTAARFVAAGGAAALSVCDHGRDSAESAVPARRQASAFELAARVRDRGGRVVATGGCFDLLHPGHVSLLRQARALGDALVVCLNSDRSVRLLKGPDRPIVSEKDRARLLTALESVDGVAVFDESDPSGLLDRLRPDVWVKGGDYTEEDLPEADVVRRHGGEIVFVPLINGYSTTSMVAAVHAAVPAKRRRGFS